MAQLANQLDILLPGDRPFVVPAPSSRRAKTGWPFDRSFQQTATPASAVSALKTGGLAHARYSDNAGRLCQVENPGETQYPQVRYDEQMTSHLDRQDDLVGKRWCGSIKIRQAHAWAAASGLGGGGHLQGRDVLGPSPQAKKKRDGRVDPINQASGKRSFTDPSASRPDPESRVGLIQPQQTADAADGGKGRASRMGHRYLAELHRSVRRWPPSRFPGVSLGRQELLQVPQRWPNHHLLAWM